MHRKYIIEDWHTGEIIEVFQSDEERNEWLSENCSTIIYRFPPLYEYNGRRLRCREEI